MCLCLGSIDKWEEKVGSFLMGRWGGKGGSIVSNTLGIYQGKNDNDSLLEGRIKAKDPLLKVDIVLSPTYLISLETWM